jgi:alanyl-tRNA synthetase
MKSREIRQRFFDFFTRHGHEKVSSSPLIPAQDPTILFANAGMNQFKDVFLGKEKRNYARAVTIQKCVRAGGKHNDLDNVGFTKRHLTFFEMMGNFSFGDYFKKEAIVYAWEFLTKEIGLPIDKLHATVYYEDQDSYILWRDMVGMPVHKIYGLQADTNFWQMGDVGPCGPCSEIFMDRGPSFGCGKDDCSPACGCDRFLEIWNLVFMQFNRELDGTLVPLAQTGVDTGMGLERLCSVIQNVDSVFHTDLFASLIERIEKLTGRVYKDESPVDQAAYHVLADHSRSACFIIADGGAPSNEGRGYVLRKIIRRAALFAQKLTDKNIFPELSSTVVQTMHEFYPELETNKSLIHKVLLSEITKFSANLVRGNQLLQRYVQDAYTTKTITGNQAFMLYDTYGFPLELVVAAAKEQGYVVDTQGFDAEMERQRAQSGKQTLDPLDYLELDGIISTFTGYQELETASAIIALVQNNVVVDSVAAGTECWVIAEKSPFFIVGGGQVPDQGWVRVEGTKVAIAAVRYIDQAIAAQIKTPAALAVGDSIISLVDRHWRVNAMKNHTATHLLQSALIALFGKTIKQSGSLVHPDYLRFDFTYHENLKADDIAKVEELVNEKIRENIPVDIEYMTLKEAISRGAIAFFGDKYNPETVRMVRVGDFSTELCGGTHVMRTGDIGTFKITEMTALSAGHRRIVALTGPRAVQLFQQVFASAKNISQECKVKIEDIEPAVLAYKEEIKQLQLAARQLKQEVWQSKAAEWLSFTELINNVPVCILFLKNIAADDVRDIGVCLEAKKAGLYVLFVQQKDKCMYYAHISSVYAQKISLKQFATWLATTYQLKGGCRDVVAQGGGNIVCSPDMVQAAKEWIAAAL